MAIKLEVRGLTGFVANLHAFDRAVGKRVRDAVRDAGKDVESLAKQLAPVDTGALRASIRTEYSEGGLTFRTGSDLDYAPFVEFGTAVSPAQPFLFPAFEAIRPHFLQDVREAVRGAAADVRPGRAA
jgi:HK97 gp10 family phage protein